MKIPYFIILLAAGLLLACRPPVKPVSEQQPEYSIADIKTVSVQLDCEKADITELDPAYVEPYCEHLRDLLKQAIHQKFPDWKLLRWYQNKEADLFIDARLEQLYGGNQFLRFLPTFEAGRSMLTVNFDIYKKGVKIAQRRLTEITRRIHFEDEKYTNEEAIEVDSNIMAGYLAAYLQDPIAFNKKYKAYWKDYYPH